jgi:hypothetical protein
MFLLDTLLYRTLFALLFDWEFIFEVELDEVVALLEYALFLVSYLDAISK